MNKTNSPKVIALTFGVLIISFAIAFYVIAWQEPSQAPPGGNVATPINVGSTGQIKTGNLVVNALGISGTGANIFSMPYGAGPGKVLTSDASGSVSWQSGVWNECMGVCGGTNTVDCGVGGWTLIASQSGTGCSDALVVAPGQQLINRAIAPKLGGKWWFATRYDTWSNAYQVIVWGTDWNNPQSIVRCRPREGPEEPSFCAFCCK